MADEPLALSTIIPPALPEREDYDAIYATVMETVRGRWFLEEYAKRNRNSDTSTVLDAIERIEGVIRGDRAEQAHQSFRLELLEMAKAINDTRAEIAAPAAPLHAQSGLAPATRPEVFAAAERLQDVAWTMRDRGLDATTCVQIETLAGSILSSASLRDANDDRARRLGEVLGYLERRINTMLESSAERIESSAVSAVSEAELQPEAAPEPPMAAEAVRHDHADLIARDLAHAATAAVDVASGVLEPHPSPAEHAVTLLDIDAFDASQQKAVTEPAETSPSETASVSELEFAGSALDVSVPSDEPPPAHHEDSPFVAAAVADTLSPDAPVTEAGSADAVSPQALLPDAPVEQEPFDLDAWAQALESPPSAEADALDSPLPAEASRPASTPLNQDPPPNDQTADEHAGFDIAPLEVAAIVLEELSSELRTGSGTPLTEEIEASFERALATTPDQPEEMPAILALEQTMVVLAAAPAVLPIADVPVEDAGPLDIEPLVVPLPTGYETAGSAPGADAPSELELDPIIVVPISVLEAQMPADDAAGAEALHLAEPQQSVHALMEAPTVAAPTSDDRPAPDTAEAVPSVDGANEIAPVPSQPELPAFTSEPVSLALGADDLASLSVASGEGEEPALPPGTNDVTLVVPTDEEVNEPTNALEAHLNLIPTGAEFPAAPDPAVITPAADMAPGVAEPLQLNVVELPADLPVVEQIAEVKDTAAAPEPPEQAAEALVTNDATATTDLLQEVTLDIGSAFEEASVFEETPVVLIASLPSEAMGSPPAEPGAIVRFDDAVETAASGPALPDTPTPEAPAAVIADQPAATEPPHEGAMLSAAWEIAITRAPELAIAPSPKPAETHASTPVPEPESAAQPIVSAAFEEPAMLTPPTMWEAPSTEKPAQIVEIEPADFLLEPLPMPPLASAPTNEPREPASAAPAHPTLPEARMASPSEPEHPAAESVGLLAGLDDDLFAELPEASGTVQTAASTPTAPALPPAPSPLATQEDQAAPVTIAPPLSPAPFPAEKLAAPPAMAPASFATPMPSPAIAVPPSPPATPARPIAKPMPRPEPNDPLAALNAMSDEERIALFT